MSNPEQMRSSRAVAGTLRQIMVAMCERLVRARHGFAYARPAESAVRRLTQAQCDLLAAGLLAELRRQSAIIDAALATGDVDTAYSAGCELLALIDEIREPVARVALDEGRPLPHSAAPGSDQGPQEV